MTLLPDFFLPAKCGSHPVFDSSLTALPGGAKEVQRKGNDSFSLAELSACALDGDLFPIDVAYVLSDLPDDVEVRARIITSHVDNRCVAAGWSAAWVHGATQRSPSRHTVALRNGLRLRLSPALHFDIAQMSFEARDVAGTVGAHRTTPLRTAIDLARFVSEDVRLTAALATLLRMPQAAAEGWPGVCQALERGRNLPYKQRAYRRLKEALAFTDAIDVVNSIDAPDTVE
jgi:hypothetical protein